LALARQAHAAGLPVVVTDSIESPVGMAVAVHAAAALPGARLAVGLGGAQLLAAVEPGSSIESWRVPAVTACGPGFAVATGAAPREAVAGA
jgi:hypothetical protein